ncbi:phosphotransferase family protein [Aspergillus heteromorphus CBS 117.55]|uniref:Phosphotransferase family protein n=1 Tax=Aspergillus heteromorphus CBS 117.55 TaxID=1448321 RepID=A0A317WAR7_9EURO|nr:phosphotransferase family protein [Aspergillus heteromorphus CBS 117.55]PWY83433.1 phosphotransferase family protein [Aspergillus heteromorphus CBS 117.55]
MHQRMQFDDTAWEKGEEISENWLRRFLDPELLRPLGRFVWRHHEPDEVTEFGALSKGFFNICVRMKYRDESSSMIRFSQPGVSMFPEEKIRNEVAVMRYIHDRTSIPVPFVLHWGAEGPSRLGPFVLMEYIDHDGDMVDALNTPGLALADAPILDPHIDEEKLEELYGQLAGVLLQLSTLALPRIGSLNQVDDFTWEVTRRPLSAGMNELVRVGTLPRSELPNQNATFDSAASYFEALAELHIKHLVHQRNDAVDSANDCRRKYVARQLFRRLARCDKLTTSALKKRPFCVWCDDFRPANVLVKDSQIVGVLDWEFTYAAPAEFSCAPPWWLLIEKPEYWPGGLDDWTNVFEKRLETFLRAMAQTKSLQGRANADGTHGTAQAAANGGR